VVHNHLQQHTICLQFERIIISYKSLNFQLLYMNLKDINLPLDSWQAQQLLEPFHYMWQTISFDQSNLVFENIVNCMHNAKCIVDFLIMNNSLHYKRLDACANLYNQQTTLMFIGTIHLYVVSFFFILYFNLSISCIMKDQLTWKYSIHQLLSYFVIRNWKNQVVDLVFT